nr:hypothetical protein [Tanacetum cinerariifolium]
MLKIAKLYQEPGQSLIPPSGKVNVDDIADKSLSRASEQPVTQHKVLTDLKTKKKKIPSSSQPKSSHKVRVIPPKKQIAETQHVEVTMATANATKSLEAFELRGAANGDPSLHYKLIIFTNKFMQEPEKIVEIEEDAEDKSMEIPTVEQLLDEVDKQNKIIQETPESPYDTESEIKVVKSYFTCQIPKLQDQIMHDSDESTDYESMPKDDLRSVSGFETADSDDTQGNDVCHSDHTFPNHNASAERLNLQIIWIISSTLPALVNTALQEQLHGLLSATLKDCLPSIIQESLQTHILASFEQFAEKQTKLNKKVVKHLNRQFNIFYVAQSDRFARNETELSKTLKYDIGKLVTTLVKSEHLLKPKEQQKSTQEFTDQLFKTISSRFSPTPLRKLTPPKDSSKGKAVVIIEEPGNELVKSQEEGGSDPKMPKLKSFITPEGPRS